MGFYASTTISHYERACVNSNSVHIVVVSNNQNYCCSSCNSYLLFFLSQWIIVCRLVQRGLINLLSTANEAPTIVLLSHLYISKLMVLTSVRR